MRTFNANNQLTGPASYTYDGNGNPTTYKGLSYAFDVRDNPTAFGSTLTAGYTSEGVRAWKQSGTNRTYFLYDGATPVVEMDHYGTVKAVNTFGVAGLVSRYVPGTAGAGTSTFYTFDETGNVSQRFDGTGALLSTHGFQAYGQYGSTSANPDPWGYKGRSGYYTDQETGLVLCTFRYYDPANGRWINRDPIGYAGGLNLYGYVGGNPVMGVDPLGLETYWQYFRQFGLGELKALGNFGMSMTEGSVFGIVTGNKFKQPFKSGCSEGEKNGELVGDQLFAIGSMAVGFAKAATAAAEGTISVYHGSINHYDDILQNGLDVAKAPTWATRDLSAARDSLTSIFRADAIKNPGIIESRIPVSEFQRVLAPAERNYSGWGGRLGSTSEIVMRTNEQIELFNRFIVR